MSQPNEQNKITLLAVSGAVFFGLALSFLLEGPLSLRLTRTNVPVARARVVETVGVPDEPTFVFDKPEAFIQFDHSTQVAPLTAKSAYIYDPHMNMELYSMNGEAELPIASLTKIATAIVAANHYDMQSVLSVPQNIYDITGSLLHLQPSENITVQEGLTGMLLVSGNDAAYMFAADYPGGYDAFIVAMNALAQNIHLTNTHFSNPIGYDEQSNYSSAKDVAHLAALLMKNEVLLDIVGLDKAIVIGNQGAIVHNVVNTNPFIEQPDVLGVKTGTSPEAGENLVIAKSINGHVLIFVVIGSKDRISDMNSLVSWAEVAYRL
ncbi:D-alanyl-D-alanine carboxypeptidase [candidate division WWE3 bacterium]|uniref:D-alanyl-D-alanine carboxypeptidase n=1 Tax=candidate division WWE3 bacterium TaxID=2053526 RepID=A0A955LGP1_UNCKA|nr:D-alanyl-D-alanine carboxypeptidase [candidate division WWE3 bacterium]